MAQSSLDILRSHIFSCREFEHRFFPICDKEVPIFIDFAHISCFKPAVLCHRFPGHFRIIIVTQHHMWTTGEDLPVFCNGDLYIAEWFTRSEEHTSELQSRGHLVCRLLLEK